MEETIKLLKCRALQYHKCADLFASYKAYPLITKEYRTNAITLLATIDILRIASGELK